MIAIELARLRRERGGRGRRVSEQGRHPQGVDKERTSGMWGEGKGEGKSSRRGCTNRREGQVVVVGASILDFTAKMKSQNILVSTVADKLIKSYQFR